MPACIAVAADCPAWDDAEPRLREPKNSAGTCAHHSSEVIKFPHPNMLGPILSSAKLTSPWQGAGVRAGSTCNTEVAGEGQLGTATESYAVHHRNCRHRQCLTVTHNGSESLNIGQRNGVTFCA